MSEELTSTKPGGADPAEDRASDPAMDQGVDPAMGEPGDAAGSASPGRFWILAAVVATGLLAAVAYWLLASGTVEWSDIGAFIVATRDWMADRPLLFFLALVILPAFPVPLSALLLMAGAVFEPRFGLLGASALTIVALAINMAWSYWAAAGPGRHLVEFILKRTRARIPDLPRGQAVQLLLILRLTPGIPYFLHNLVLGFLRTSFPLYMVLSVLIIGPVAVGWIISGGAIMDGRVGLAMLGLGIILIFAFVTRMIAGWLRRRQEAAAAAAE